MTVEIVVVLILAVAAVVLFASEKFPVDLVALMLMATLLLTGIVTVEEGISGFSNTATVTVGAMFILSAGLFKTGIVNYLGSHVIKLYRFNFWIAMVATMIVAAILSAFINNTPVVAIFIPILLGVASKINVSVSKLLIPLSFAAMFGGVCTLIGTSTNILVSTIAERYGQPAMTMFEFTPLGAIFLAAGILYMLLIGIHLIPDRRTEEDLTKDFGMGDYIAEIVLLPETKSVGQRLHESALVREVDIEVLEVTRNGKKLRLPPSRLVLQASDVLRVVGDVEKIKKLQEREGIKLKPLARLQDGDLMDEETTLVEAIVAPNSFLEGKTLKQVRFQEVYEATALALRHRGTVLHTKLGTTKLKAGDVLLVEAPKDRLQRLKEDDAFVFVTEVGLPQFRREKTLPALAIVGGVIAVAAAGMVPIVVSAISGCVLLVLSRCLTLEEAYKAIDWKVIFLLAGALTLGVALEKTGSALVLSNLLITSVGSFGPLALVAAFYLLTSLLTETMSNNATAVLLAPIAIVAADSLQVDARPFLMAIAFAASASFMTPVGYHTNTMIYGVGQYKYGDFLKVGTPLNILFWIIATLLIPYFWPFE